MKQILPIFTAAVLALGLVSPAHAQYIWLDKNNVKVYSDTPPPSDIPNSRILKGPRNFKAKNIEEKQPEAANGTANHASKPPMTTAEKNAEYKKRHQEETEKRKKAEAEEKAKQGKAENCERARAYQRSLQAGQRISRTNAKGEREYISDEERAAETNRVNESLKDCN